MESLSQAIKNSDVPSGPDNFISQLDRDGVPEDRIALLLGHERGKTETFKTYSKHAASPMELLGYVELVQYGFT